MTVTLGDGSTVNAEEILVATGRTPQSVDLGLEAVGVKADKYVEVDRHMRVLGQDWLYVIGDLNGTSSEPGLATLDRGLTDAHEAAGTGPGFTWRPDALEPLGVAVLRIDHVMSGAG